MRFRVEAAAILAREGFLDHRVCGFSWQGVRGREDHREEHGRRAQEWYSTLLDDDAAPTSGTSSPASRHDACDRLLHPSHPCSNARVEYMHVDLLTRKSSWCYRGNSIHVCIELSVCATPASTRSYSNAYLRPPTHPEPRESFQLSKCLSHDRQTYVHLAARRDRDSQHVPVAYKPVSVPSETMLCISHPPLDKYALSFPLQPVMRTFRDDGRTLADERESHEQNAR